MKNKLILKDKTILEIKKELNKEIEGNKLYLELPKEGTKEEEILSIFNKLKLYNHMTIKMEEYPELYIQIMKN